MVTSARVRRLHFRLAALAGALALMILVCLPQPQLTHASGATLDATQLALDDLARTQGAGLVRSWWIDHATNQVVVRTPFPATDPETRRFLDGASAYGDRIRIEPWSGTLQTTTKANLYGGQLVDMSDGYTCTTGFNARTSKGKAVMITAGHCAVGKPRFFRKGKLIGKTLKYSYPKNDYGIFAVDTRKWKPRASVVRWDGRVQAVRGFSKVSAGTSICKSGRSTKWTCGKVKAYNETVNYGHGHIVTGLARHTACVEDGDSGGAVMSGTKAQGITSGAELWKKGSRYVCGAKVGKTSISYYQPIGEVLKNYNLTLLVR